MRPISLLRDLSLLSVIAGILFFGNLGGARLWDRDEPRNATCAREMLARGDWVVPTFNAELRTHKPIMLYWLTMASYSVLGVSEFAARLPSATLSCGTVLLTYLIGLRLFGRRPAIWSACALATFVMMGVTGRAATPDGCLIFFSAAAMAWYVYSVWPPRQPTAARTELVRRGAIPFTNSLAAAWGLYAIMGLAVLAKGPVGMVLPTAVIGMFCLLARCPRPAANETRVHDGFWRRAQAWFEFGLRVCEPRSFYRTCGTMRPCLALLVVCLVAGPWYVWVGIRTDGQWLREFFWEHNVSRAVSPMEGHHGSFLFYPLALLACCFPWSVLTLPTLLSTTRQLREETREHSIDRDSILFLYCWVGVYVAIFSLAQTKLPSYVAPTFPAVALLFGRFVSDWEQSRTRVADLWWPLGMTIFGLVGIVLSVGIPLAVRRYLPAESAAIWLVLVGAIPLAGAAVALICHRQGRLAWSTRAFAASAVALSLVLFSVVADRVSQHQDCERLLRDLPLDAQASLASYAALEPSWVFYSQHTIRQFDAGSAAAAAEFLRAEPSAYLIVTDQYLTSLQQACADPLWVVDRGRYFLRDRELLLVRSQAPMECGEAAPPSKVAERSAFSAAP